MKNSFAHIKNTTLAFLEKEIKDAHRKKYLLAVSGGADSVLLAHIFHALKLNFSIAHVNYSLRSNESDADAVFVKNLAKKLNVDFHYKKVNTKKVQKKGESVQMIARDIRYAFFEELLNEEKLDYMVLAHHASDQVETVLMNLFRGCGITGLTGMAGKNENKLRPFLSIPQKEITKALKEKKIKFCNDSSNLKSDYKRNFLRNKVLPLIETKWPGLEKTLLNNIEFFKIAAKILAQADTFSLDFDKSFSIDLGPIQENDIQLAAFTKQAYKNGFNQNALLKKLVDSSNNESKIVEGKKGILEFKNKKIHYTPFAAKKEIPKVVLKQNHLIVSGVDSSFFKSRMERVSKQAVKGKIHIRKWKPGDKMIPLGMKGQKKISDILTDLKLTAVQKSEVYLVSDEQKPLWLVGFRLDDRAKLKGNELLKDILVIETV